jgi:hypothetical protein
MTSVPGLAATRGGDLQALLAVLDPDVVRRADRAALRAGAATELRGAQRVAEETAPTRVWHGSQRLRW